MRVDSLPISANHAPGKRMRRPFIGPLSCLHPQTVNCNALFAAQSHWLSAYLPPTPAQLAQAAVQARALKQPKCLKSRQRPAAQQVRQDQASVP